MSEPRNITRPNSSGRHHYQSRPTPGGPSIRTRRSSRPGFRLGTKVELPWSRNFFATIDSGSHGSDDPGATPVGDSGRHHVRSGSRGYGYGRVQLGADRTTKSGAVRSKGKHWMSFRSCPGLQPEYGRPRDWFQRDSDHPSVSGHVQPNLVRLATVSPGKPTMRTATKGHSRNSGGHASKVCH
jgi:hypothetical protein